MLAVTRVALLPSAYVPTLGGVQELTRHLARHLQGLGDEVEVWTTVNDDPTGPRVEELDGVRIRRFPMPLPSANPVVGLGSIVGGAGTLRQMCRAAREFRPDVLHVQCFGPNGIYATGVSRLTGIPLVISLQGETRMDDTDIFEVSSTLRFGLRSGIRRASVVTGCSGFTLLDAEQRFGLEPGSGRVVFNGVAEEASASPAVDTERYVLAVGRVVEKKGFDLLIRAWARISSDQPDVELVIAGDGPALPELRRLAETLGVSSRVRFFGRASRDQVAALMISAEAFVMPSRLEPFGIVILEAWRAGAAVICTNRGGPPEFVENGRTGMLVDPFDQEDMAATIDRVLASSTLRKLLSANGSEQVKDFYWTVVAERYREVYASVRRRPTSREPSAHDRTRSR